MSNSVGRHTAATSKKDSPPPGAKASQSTNPSSSEINPPAAPIASQLFSPQLLTPSTQPNIQEKQLQQETPSIQQGQTDKKRKSAPTSSSANPSSQEKKNKPESNLQLCTSSSSFSPAHAQQETKKYIPKLDTVGGGDCGVQAINVALGEQNRKNPLKSTRLRIVNINQNYIKIMLLQQEISFNKEELINLKTIYENIFKNINRFTLFMTKNLAEELNAEGIDDQTINNLNKLILDIRKQNNFNFTEDLWREVLKRSLGINATNLLEDHQIKDINVNTYMNKVKKDGVWLTREDIVGYMLSEGYYLTNSQVPNQNNLTILQFTHLENNNKVVYIANDATAQQASHSMVSGTHWFCVVPQDKQTQSKSVTTATENKDVSHQEESQPFFKSQKTKESGIGTSEKNSKPTHLPTENDPSAEPPTNRKNQPAETTATTTSTSPTAASDAKSYKILHPRDGSNSGVQAINVALGLGTREEDIKNTKTKIAKANQNFIGIMEILKKSSLNENDLKMLSIFCQNIFQNKEQFKNFIQNKISKKVKNLAKNSEETAQFDKLKEDIFSCKEYNFNEDMWRKIFAISFNAYTHALLKAHKIEDNQSHSNIIYFQKIKENSTHLSKIDIVCYMLHQGYALINSQVSNNQQLNILQFKHFENNKVVYIANEMPIQAVSDQGVFSIHWVCVRPEEEKSVGSTHTNATTTSTTELLPSTQSFQATVQPQSKSSFSSINPSAKAATDPKDIWKKQPAKATIQGQSQRKYNQSQFIPITSNRKYEKITKNKIELDDSAILVKAGKQYYTYEDAYKLAQNPHTQRHIFQSWEHFPSDKPIHTVYADSDSAVRHIWEFLKENKEDVALLEDGNYIMCYARGKLFDCFESMSGEPDIFLVPTHVMEIVIRISSLPTTTRSRSQGINHEEKILKIEHHYPIALDILGNYSKVPEVNKFYNYEN